MDTATPAAHTDPASAADHGLRRGPASLRPVRPGARPWPLHDAAASRSVEQAATALHPQPPLMARAGLAVARLGRALAPHATRTLVLAGPGNNGGDGLVAARLLHTARHPVSVRLVADPARLPGDATLALRAAAGAGVDIRPFDPGEALALSPQDLLIDALLGIGSRRAPEGGIAAAIRASRRLGARILSVDLPSGLHPDTGALWGGEAVRADATLALLTIKPGCTTALGRDHCGQLWWDDLGAGLCEPTAWLAASPARPARPHAGHKGRFGDVWVLGGADGMSGALVLAAHAALAAGAGRVYACSLQASGDLALRPEVMQRPLALLQATTPPAGATVVAGCGGGTEIAGALPVVLSHVARLVLDADGLNAVATSFALQQALRARSRQGLATVLTPHPLEAARLLGCRADAVQADRLGAARQLAQMFDCWVVLKGSGTVIASPLGLPWINPTGNASLGTPGTGDVLAGWLGGLWAQWSGQADSTVDGSGEPRSNDEAAGAAARAAAWWHGLAADRWQERGHAGALRAGDLIEAMAAVA